MDEIVVSESLAIYSLKMISIAGATSRQEAQRYSLNTALFPARHVIRYIVVWISETVNLIVCIEFRRSVVW